MSEKTRRLPRLRRALAWFFRLRGSPEAVALGLAIGVFIGFTPPIGLQTVSAIFLATFLNANRPAAVAGTLLSNPLTQVPVSLAAYWVGTLFWPGPPMERVRAAIAKAIAGSSATSPFEPGSALREFAAVSRDAFVPLWIGGAILGVVAAGLAYVLGVRIIRRARQRFGHPDETGEET